jgi:hypothetical protein
MKAMRIHPIYFQYNCVEGDKADLRQAKAVLRHRPDIIIFETPQGSRSPNTIFNRYTCRNKPLGQVDALIKSLRVSAKKFPYAKGDIEIWENIKFLWSEGKNVQLYNVDAPDSLRREYFFHLRSLGGYPTAREDWLFWAYLYVREVYMAKNMRWVLAHASQQSRPVVLVFLQSIHWEHTQFQLRRPREAELWNYYFKQFPKLTPSTIAPEIKKRSPVFYKFWKKALRQHRSFVGEIV